MFLLLLLYYCTLISPRFNNSRIFAEALKADTDLGTKLCKKECMGKLSAEHYYNAIRVKLQFCVQIYKSGLQICKPHISSKFRPFLLLDAFYEFSRCDTCNFLEIPDRCSTLIVSYISKQLR